MLSCRYGVVTLWTTQVAVQGYASYVETVLHCQVLAAWENLEFVGLV